MNKPPDLPQMKQSKPRQEPPTAVVAMNHSQEITVTLSTPLVAWTTWTLSRYDLRLNRAQAAILRSLAATLEERGAELESGKSVTRPTDALKWLLEKISTDS